MKSTVSEAGRFISRRLRTAVRISRSARARWKNRRPGRMSGALKTPERTFTASLLFVQGRISAVASDMLAHLTEGFSVHASQRFKKSVEIARNVDEVHDEYAFIDMAVHDVMPSLAMAH